MPYIRADAQKPLISGVIGLQQMEANDVNPGARAPHYENFQKML
jgi:hypothetical protein